MPTSFRPGSAALLFPRHDRAGREREWTETDWRNRRRRVYQSEPDEHGQRHGAAITVSVSSDPRPYRLRGSFGSLLLWDGRSIAYVAKQIGRDVATLAKHYAGVLRELEDQPRVSAAETILTARRQLEAPERAQAANHPTDRR